MSPSRQGAVVAADLRLVAGGPEVSCSGPSEPGISERVGDGVGRRSGGPCSLHWMMRVQPPGRGIAAGQLRFKIFEHQSRENESSYTRRARMSGHAGNHVIKLLYRHAGKKSHFFIYSHL